MPIQLSTDRISLKERPSYWNFLVSSVLGRLHTVPSSSNRFQGKITYSHLSSIPIAQVASTQLTVHRPEKFIQNRDEDFYKVNFQLAGASTLKQLGREALLEPGQWAIYDNTRPYELHFHSDYRQLLFLIPRSQLLKRLPTADLFLARPQTNQNGMGKLLHQFVSGALLESDHMTPASQAQTVQMMLDMLTLSLTESQQMANPLPAASRIVQFKQFILTHLHNPDLDAEMLANHFHLSKRYTQKIFTQEGLSIHQFIFSQRLERCKHDLEDPRLANQSIGGIALGWGFKSNAHFSRLFRATFGMTPSAYRKLKKDALSQS